MKIKEYILVPGKEGPSERAQADHVADRRQPPTNNQK